ncbi:MAG TPA: SBBP repeat-containing protein [Acidobacteriota bacterium]|nr:SBBP repeat-containing protein [Acidobacteriota bacterium]
MFQHCHRKPALALAAAVCLMASPVPAFAEASQPMRLTYFGGNASELAFPRVATAVGHDGSVYIAGYTTSEDLLASATAVYGDDVSGEEAFVARFSSDLSTLLGLAVLTGSGDDRATSVAVDEAGRVYVGGHTTSEGFPYISGSYDTTYNGTGSSPYGNGDVFVARFDSELFELQACTFLGGAGADYSHCMVLNGAGLVCISGSTNSSDFPVSPDAYDTTRSPSGSFGLDVFISVLDADLETLVASTYFGGTADDFTEAIVVSAAGDIYVSGWTNSMSFPLVSTCYDLTYNGGMYDSFISKLDGNLTTLIASTFLGGNYWDMVYSICLDGSGSVFVTGHTASKYDFPYTPDAYDTLYNGVLNQGATDDCFVSKFDENLTVLSASTFLGGQNWDCGFTMVLDDSGYVFVGNHTNSLDFPTSPVTYDADYNGGQYDLTIVRLNNDLSELLFSSYLGGQEREYYPGLALDTATNLFAAAATGSSDLPYSSDAFDTSLNGSRDIMVAFLPKGYWVDTDGDGHLDVFDNCPLVPNPDQEDSDDDAVGDSCDVCQGHDDNADADGDLVPDGCDDCTDTDGDGYGNPGYPFNTCDDDNCPDVYNPGQEDNDGDGTGNACCCANGTGNVDGDPGEIVDIGDLTRLIGYLFISQDPLGCPGEANIDGDEAGVVDIGDLTKLIDYLFISNTPPAVCL